jgi:hypothetical protein
MASIQINDTVLNAAMDAEYNAAGFTYTLILTDDGSAISGASETCDFNAASMDSTKSMVDLASPVYFALASGITVDGLSLSRSDGTSLGILSESVTSKTYTAAGTYTVSDLIVKVGK